MNKNISVRFQQTHGYWYSVFLMKLLYCHDFMKNINFTIVLSCPSRMLEYYFSKGFVILEHKSKNINNYYK